MYHTELENELSNNKYRIENNKMNRSKTSYKKSPHILTDLERLRLTVNQSTVLAPKTHIRFNGVFLLGTTPALASKTGEVNPDLRIRACQDEWLRWPRF
jgi:hypothetical protein